ncbi:nucleolar RNA-binding Nop10p family protein [Sulfodiicoccus acidiphilus]|nr:RNA-protein complex protein Nop10 [Sulfodiicoccus acidiphilus]
MKCYNCGKYSLGEVCPNCGFKTRVCHPPRFSPVDKYVMERLKAKGIGC